MRPRLIALPDLAAALAETAGVFAENAGRILEIHMRGDAKAMRILAARTASIALGIKIKPNALASAMFTTKRGKIVIAFIDEYQREHAIKAEKSTDEIALPSEAQHAKAGILFVAHPQKRRIFKKPDGDNGMTTIYTQLDMSIGIKSQEKKRGPYRVRIFSGNLPERPKAQLAAAIKPHAKLIK